jgi:hypothetical protein
MTQMIIDKVNAMAADQPPLLTFLDRNGMEITDEDDELLETPETPHEIPGVIGNAAQITGVDKDAALGEAVEEIIEDTQVEDVELEDDLCNNPTQDYITDDVPTITDDAPTFEHQPQVIESPTTPTKPETPSKSQQPSRICKQVQSYVLSMKGKSYQYAAAQLAQTENEPQIVELVMTQLSLKAGIKMWGNKATSAAEAEMKQLHWRNTFKPV